MTAILFQATCPSCGARVPFRSAASVMAVCEYCQSTVLREADHVKDQGKMSAVLEDFSPLQIGASGVDQGVGFALVGRIQLQYSDGMWNEWYLQFEDGSNGWLSDGSGQYILTRSVGVVPTAPRFEQLSVNKPVFYKTRDFRVTDLRTAQCTGGQGELPFVVGQGWQARVADLRKDQQFLTLDYSEGRTQPEGFAGRAVTLSELHMQLLRDTDQISSSSGNIKGSLQSLECPNCGSTVPYVFGVAEHLVCPACRAEVAIAGDTATVLAKHKELTTLKTALQLGDRGNIAGLDYVLIGIAQMEEVGDADESSLWTEYLLYSTSAGFLWLVDEGASDWQKVTVLNELPEEKSGYVVWKNERWNLEWRYQGRVMYAVGAFNWRIKIGDTNSIRDYQRGKQTLTAEQNTQEITWSHSEPIAGSIVRTWFGKKQPKPAHPQAKSATKKTQAATPSIDVAHGLIFKWMAGILWLLNLPLILFGSGSLMLTLIATLILWVIAKVAEQKQHED